MPRIAHVWPEPVRTGEDPATGAPVVEVAMTVECATGLGERLLALAR